MIPSSDNVPSHVTLQNISHSDRNDMMLLTTPQSKLQVGFFTITPASGTIPTGNAQLITIECFAEIKGVSEEEFAIEISDRDTVSFRYGVPYVLQAEGHLPSIETTDITTIFEEHRICSDLTTLKPIELVDKGSYGCGVYGVAENCFLFTNVLVGSRVRARFCIANRGRVPADVLFELRSTGLIPSQSPSRPSGQSSRSLTPADAFEVDPEREQIEPHTCTYVNVTFSPSAMHKYAAQFRVYLENVPSMGSTGSGRASYTPGGSKLATALPVLSFELAGEGHLPRLTVLEPTVRSRQGHVMCVFQRVQLGRQTSRSLMLKNTGILNSRVSYEVIILPAHVYMIIHCLLHELRPTIRSLIFF
ncbi:hypothetical protein P879_03219 [Paragonimus westermani]|uniref:Hydrocephalus-inducing protein n=1 Tax=Paragonimus westermani TaxID=34504 RepID=A0A8T0D4U4_9TREM|nr:hypothetical protein P879_03219 [Paragonimus westermani]